MKTHWNDYKESDEHRQVTVCGLDIGFTLIELLVVLSVIALLASLLLPALAKSKGKAQAITCLNNLKQLQLGWKMYVDDNKDTFPPNISRLVGFDQVNMVVDGRVPWVLGNAQLDISTSNITNGVLYGHVGSPTVYRCPADQSTVRDHPRLRRTRSYSTPEFFNCDVISHGALDGINDNVANLRKLSQLTDPGPSLTWVFIDEHEMSIDDGIFAIEFPGPPWPGQEIWAAFPGDRHSNGANVSFADGHAEPHAWRAHRKISVYTASKTYIRPDDTNNLADLHWLHDRIQHAH
jgi:prepilin-type processing-associated H-X9-DG protein/prepilin-type N-terminal cleavage/methylation domain-containing protein